MSPLTVDSTDLRAGETLREYGRRVRPIRNTRRASARRAMASALRAVGRHHHVHGGF